LGKDSFNKPASEEALDVPQAEETASEAVSSAAKAVRVDSVEHALNDHAEQDVEQAAQETTPETVQVRNETKERERSYRSSDGEEWKNRALQLQADMARYRQRQKRIAHEQAQADQVALLNDVLAVADNLERALAAAQGGPAGRDETDPLTQGVEMTRTALQQTLAKYGLEQFQVMGEPFDPAWHQAVHIVPANVFGVRPGTIVQVLEEGYRRQGALFRPAKVVVAQ
jgi:molecular chaperone GrpE